MFECILLMPETRRTILKTVLLFGGTQLFQMLVNLLRGKFIALFIGAEGMGLNAIYTSSLAWVITIFGAGIATGLVKPLATATALGRNLRVDLWVSGAKWLTAGLALVAGAVTFCMARPLSEWSTGSESYAIHYRMLALMVVFNLLAQTNQAVLAGTRQVKRVARCTLWSAVATLLVSVPALYVWRLQGVSVALLLSAVAGYAVSYYYIGKETRGKVRLTWRRFKVLLVPLLQLGGAMVVTVLAGNLSAYLLNMYIAHTGNLHDVGLYNAGLSLTLQAVSLVFAAMAADYFPRLSAVVADKADMSDTINRQTEVTLCLAVPVLCAVMFFSQAIIYLFLSHNFMVLHTFLRWLCVGMVLKAVAYPLGYVSFAHEDKRTFMWLEGGVGQLSTLLLGILGYYCGGLQGLGIAFVVDFAGYALLVFCVCKLRYGYKPHAKTLKLTLISVVLSVSLLVVSSLVSATTWWILGIVATPMIVFCYARKLNAYTQWWQTLQQRIRHQHCNTTK